MKIRHPASTGLSALARHHLRVIQALACLFVLPWSAHTFAHSGGITGFATITVHEQSVTYGLTMSAIPAGPLSEQMHLTQPGTPPDYVPFITAISSNIRLSTETGICSAAEAKIHPPTATSISMAGTVEFRCPGKINRLTIRDDLPEAWGKDHHTVSMIVWSGGSQQFAFGADAREVTVEVVAETTHARGAGSFFPLGVEHILTGYDHLLFLLVLILRGGNVWSLLKIITAFTLAHSFTLALAALDIVTLPSAIVESVIALSIAYVALENLLPRYAVSRRWTVSFIFGLVHGFGFSSALREVGLPKDGLLLSLLNFNLGVEVGQLTVVLMVIPILIWVKTKTWEPRMATAFSSVVLAVGGALFIQRAFFVAWS
jgi:hydrogenase/urease accessory protein HupE